MKINTRQLGLLLSGSMLVLGLGGCGGGGGGISGTPAPPPSPSPSPTPTPTPTPSPTPTPPPPPPPASVFDTAEYRASNAAVTAGAITAYNAGATGRNVKIAIIDSGLNGTLAEFSGRIDPASQDVAGGTNQILDREGHGTAVTAVAAAARNNANIMGVAFDATIISLNTADPAGCTSNGCSHYDDDIARAIDIARENGARVINISLGGPTIAGVLTTALARAAEAGIVVVISAGNDGSQTPAGLAQLAAGRAGNGQTIIAGAVDPAGNMSTFSNWAGDYAPHYLAALGVNVATINEDGERIRMEGTSFSAPVISGAAALLASAFPNLTGAQIVEILFRSANDIGAAGVDNKFGNGMLNITRAFQPIGATSLAGSNVALSTSNNGEVSAAMGDATAQGLEGAIILDGYSRAFAMNLGKTLRHAVKDRPLGRAIGSNLRTRGITAGATSVSVTVLEKLNGQPWVGLAQTGMTYEDSRQVQLLASAAVTRLGPRTQAAIGLSESGRSLQQRLSNAQSGAFLIAQDPAERNGFQAGPAQSFGLRQQIGKLGLTVTTEDGEIYRGGVRIGDEEESYRLTSVTLDRKLGVATLSLGLSHLDEQETVLGGRLSSEIFGGGSSSYFIDGVGLVDLGRGFGAGLRYRIGWTRLAGGGELGQAGRLASNAFSFDIGKYSAFVAGDRFALRVTQPLRVQSGGLGVRLPVSYDYTTGAVGFENRTLNLAPSGREIDFEAAYSIRVGAGDLGANLFLRRQPGHILAAGNDVGGVVRVAWGF